jgi:hypothetical protein
MAATGVRSSRTDPERRAEEDSVPAMACARVDLPLPDAPVQTTQSPGRTEALTEASTSCRP